MSSSLLNLTEYESDNEELADEANFGVSCREMSHEEDESPSRDDTVRLAPPGPSQQLELGSREQGTEKDQVLSEENSEPANELYALCMPDMEFDVEIPPSPSELPDAEIAAKLEHFKALKNRGIHFNDRLVNSRAFQNPAALEKLASFVGITEPCGTNLDPMVWDPSSLGPRDFIDGPEGLLAQQKAQVEQRVATRKRVEFESARESQVGTNQRNDLRKVRSRSRSRSRSPRTLPTDQSRRRQR